MMIFLKCLWIFLGLLAIIFLALGHLMGEEEMLTFWFIDEQLGKRELLGYAAFATLAAAAFGGTYWIRLPPNPNASIQ